MSWIAFGDEHSRTDEFDYNLDYTAMMAPTIVTQSLRRKHYLVFLVVIISLILRVQIVIAPGLFKLEKAEVSEGVRIEVLDVFNGAEDSIGSNKTNAYHMTHAVHNFGMPPPFGINITQNVAYQTNTNEIYPMGP
ncbi:hypothetical protein CPLU01_15152 [Colletotrichum plurivorum]|uniref:Uncharacterized protein n=1 Tax=Colletotrichum plurivorum TaxID=2175906 RepID=A0A8H6MWW1_9PEZI|nr:hypothetical protein CPLU01_15152 [Colletotrichum plurivorum]